MSQEWLKKLAEASGDKEFLKRARQQPRSTAASTAAGGPRRSLIGAVFSFFFRILILAAIAEAVAMFIMAMTFELTEEPLGYIFHYTAWYFLQGLPAAVYSELQPTLSNMQDALPFIAPAALALATTIYLLPSINAARNRSPVRFLVYIVNLAFGWAIVGWLIALVLSLISGIAGRSGGMIEAAKAAAAAARRAGGQGRGNQPQRQSSGPAAARQAAAATRAAITAAATAARETPARTRGEPTVRRLGGRDESWVRPR